MTEPWNIKSSNERKADSVPTFIIICEDAVSEPIYFKYFETSSIKVNPIGKKKSKIDNVLNAINHCILSNELKYEGSELTRLNQDTQIWCVYDKDTDFTSAEKILKGNSDFNQSIKMAEDIGMKVAWSNDSFELWILLHFVDVDPTDQAYNNRKTYYDELTDIFKKLEHPNEDLMKALAYINFNYKESLKSEKNFRNIVRKEILSNTNIAIERAKVIEQYHSKTLKPYHEKSPCTLVHHLVEELIRLGGKKI